MSTKVPQRKIGDSNVSAIGFGAMGMSAFYKSKNSPPTEEHHLQVLTEAADSGITFWDTRYSPPRSPAETRCTTRLTHSDVYGPFTNEELLGKWFSQTGRRNETFGYQVCCLYTPYDCVNLAWEDGKVVVRGDAEHVQRACEASLKRLGTDHIDLYYQHRVDPKTKIEETVGAMASLVQQGKVRYLGLSECSSRTLRRAHAIHPIAAVQIEYSPFTLDIEYPSINLKETCTELGVAIVAYSPLGRGMLTGRFKSREDFASDDRRLELPRFSEENFPKNLALVEKIAEVAGRKGCSSG
jgi:aryl-alcohol dehydrogenase-like predicted oxidoreductase